MRVATHQDLARALEQTRRRTLGLIEAWCEALPSLRVPQDPALNLPLWEWGHVGWFQAWWIGRNRQRALGVRADPDHVRDAPLRADADALYDSSRVPHASRWSLDLPDRAQTLADLERTQEQTLSLLARDGAAGMDLYFWHLVLAHEAMHNEASVYMAQALGLPVPARWAVGDGDGKAGSHGAQMPPQPSVQPDSWHVPPQEFVLGHQGPGFCFDNELGAHVVSLPAFEIDAQPVSWSRYLAFVEDTGHRLPKDLERRDGVWMQRVFGQWKPLRLEAAASFLGADDAQAWCDWAGRALPSEAQWEAAARSAPAGAFRWGEVWEWTSSVFMPYPGFEPHPYRDYSAPWFGTHRVLRGASRWTEPHLVCPSYRNFFLPQRRDIPAGFRSVSIQSPSAGAQNTAKRA